MISILTTIAIICLAFWFSFSATKVTQRLVIPLFYLAAFGLIAYSIYQAYQSIAPNWTNAALYLLKISAISLFMLMLSKSKLHKGLIWIFAALGGFWIFPNTTKAPLLTLDNQAEFLVEIDNNRELDQLKNILEPYDATLSKAFQISESSPLNKYYTLNIRDDRQNQVQRYLNKLSFIDYFEQNEIVQIDPFLMTEPPVSTRKESKINDPLYDKQWGLQLLDPVQFRQVIQDGSLQPVAKTKLAILDTGVDGIHEDLKDVYYSTNSKYDKDHIGHGTHCAGIAAATNDNFKGIASLPGNDLVEITSIKVLSRINGSGTQQEIIQGMIEAVDAGVQVISMSLGGRTSDKKQRAYRLAVEYAEEHQVTVVVAAGNNGGDARSITPANIPGVITVAAVDENLKRASFSNSVRYVDMGIAAPGVNIMSTVPNHKYRSMNGTSMATPFVASLVSVIKAYNPQLSTAEIYEFLNGAGIETLDTEDVGKIIDPVRTIEQLIK